MEEYLEGRNQLHIEEKKAILFVKQWAKDVRQSLPLEKAIWEGFKDYLQIQWLPIPSLRVNIIHDVTWTPHSNLSTSCQIDPLVVFTHALSPLPHRWENLGAWNTLPTSCQNLNSTSTLSLNATSSMIEGECKVILKWCRVLPFGPSGDKLSPTQESAHMYRGQT